MFCGGDETRTVAVSDTLVSFCKLESFQAVSILTYTTRCKTEICIGATSSVFHIIRCLFFS